MIILGITYALIQGEQNYINDLILDTPMFSFKLFIMFAPLIVFWSGIMEVAKDGGFLKFISKILSPIVNFLFKKEDKETKEYISANIAANLLGLGSCATPLGLSAMKNMQKKNKNKKVATSSMTKLILINTSGLTLIPTYIIALRKASDISAIDVTKFVIIATMFSTLFAIILIKGLKL